MEKLFIPAAKSTPEINFSPDDCRLTIIGESYPENSSIFYKPLLERIEEISKQLEKQFVVDIHLNYLNTSSTKAILNLLDILNDAYLQGKDILINWFCDMENELLYETAIEFDSFFEIGLHINPEVESVK